ncbi:fumarylacetoacetate hydrolase family protein [Acetobacter conturbans]|uniref:FAA hydrolase family protein n=1 Tax=Acetobacter conturbans TaxID=1737472 RepID=A0ABX0K520_9PROT|nr:fumarylacetoacetate hydrolase family protein [Acetobacter conturbans]NHN89255.1 FAA hydrolase family protein [Acetobacter conturbans]
MRYVFPPAPTPSIPVSGTDSAFPVRRIWCVGRNYGEHTREMGGDPANDTPIFFAKPADAVTLDRTLPFPLHTTDLHHEIELAVAIGGQGVHVPAGKALDLVYGYALALDMTRRDLQAIAKKKGQPWDLAKGFDQSCPITPIRPVTEIGHPTQGRISLSVNGEIRQNGEIRDLIWPIPEIIATLSNFVELRPGDLILTGTPSGVGPVLAGDRLVGECDGVGRLEVAYATRD